MLSKASVSKFSYFWQASFTEHYFFTCMSKNITYCWKKYLFYHDICQYVTSEFYPPPLTQNDKMLFDTEIKIFMNRFLTLWCIEFVVENSLKLSGEKFRKVIILFPRHTYLLCNFCYGLIIYYRPTSIRGCIALPPLTPTIDTESQDLQYVNNFSDLAR